MRNLTVPCLTLALFTVPACHLQDDDAGDEYRKGIPNKATIEVQVPGATGQALSVEGEGKVSEYYRLTRTVSRDVNAGVYFVLSLVREVVRHRPTAVTDNSAVWGPFSEPLEPIAWKVTVTRTTPNEYAYKFEGRDKASLTGNFETVLSGVHRPATGSGGAPMEGFGEGNFLLDFEARNRLPLPDKDIGSAAITYSRPSLSAPVQITAQFKAVKDDERPGRKVDVDYRYKRNAGGGGELEFTYKPDAVAAGVGQVAVMSRWNEAGAGRADVTAKGGTLPADTQATANECWSTSFASVFVQASWDPSLAYGTEAVCAFPTASYARLKL